jgi:hypothetical protein
MKKTHYLTVTVQEGNRLDIPLPNVPVGETVEVILIVPESESSDRQTFLQLSIEERRRILSEQVEAMKEYYQEDPDWKDWVNFDNGETDD